MRFSVHLCQRKFLNKHLRHFHHVAHISFIPALVTKIYVPSFCNVRTSPVSPVMSPVHVMHEFVHSISTWQWIHVWIQTRFQCSGMVAECFVNTYIPYVVSLRTQRRVKQCWQGSWKSQYAKERILIWVYCICSWHARNLRISTQIATKTRIGWQFQSNKDILLRPHLRTTKRPTPQKMRKPDWFNYHRIFSLYVQAQHVA